MTGVLVHVTCHWLLQHRHYCSDGTSRTSYFVKIENMHLPTTARESKSAPSPQSSGSPLQRLLLHTPVRHTSSVDNLSGQSSTSRQLTNSPNYTSLVLRNVPGASETVGSLRSVPVASETVGSLRSVPVASDAVGSLMSVPGASETVGSLRSVPVASETVGSLRSVPVASETVGRLRSVPVASETVGSLRSVPVASETVGSLRSVPVASETVCSLWSVPVASDAVGSLMSVPGASETVGSLRSLPEVSETVDSLQGATLHYTAECNGVIGGTWPPYSRHSVELCSRKLNVSDKYVDQQKCNVHDKGTVNNTTNSVVGDTSMTQTHSRSGPMMTFHDTRVVNTSLLQRCAPKRLMRSSLSGATVPKHLCSWHVDSRDTSVRVLNLSSNSSKDSLVTCSSVTTTSSQYEARTQGPRQQERRCLAAEPTTAAALRCHKSPRRAPVTAWTANDVYAFVLSLPHGALYAQVSAASSRHHCH